MDAVPPRPPPRVLRQTSAGCPAGSIRRFSRRHGRPGSRCGEPSRAPAVCRPHPDGRWGPSGGCRYRRAGDAETAGSGQGVLSPGVLWRPWPGGRRQGEDTENRPAGQARAGLPGTAPSGSGRDATAGPAENPPSRTATDDGRAGACSAKPAGPGPRPQGPVSL